MSGESYRYMGVKARDESRQPAPDRPSQGSRKKNTKKWCKGKPGVKHQYEPYKEMHLLGSRTFYLRYLKCKVCGRQEWKSVSE